MPVFSVLLLGSQFWGFVLFGVLLLLFKLRASEK